MNQNKIKALREEWAAKVIMLSEDYIGARTKLLKAQQLYPALDNIDAMLIVCNILLLAGSINLSDSKIDDYRILEILTPSQPYTGVRCHYQKLVTLIQPLRDEFPGTELAIHLVQEALSKLSDGDKHPECDVKQGTSCVGQITACNRVFPSQTLGGENEEGVSAGVLSERRRNLEPNLLAYHDGIDEQDDIMNLQTTSSEGDIYWSPRTVTPRKRDQEFYDFEKNKKAEMIKDGQIWAAHYQANVPRDYRYAQINNNGNYGLSVTWLKPVGTSPSERSWCVAGLPVGCGLFDRNPEIKNEVVRPMVFSYQCYGFQAEKENQFKIYPKNGEIWALYKNWNIEEWACNPEKFKGCRFELVELLSEFSRFSGADVVSLVKLDGFRSVFLRQTSGGNPVIYKIPANNLYIFSHNVPGYRLMDGIFELDQLALPDDVVTDDINTLMVLKEENLGCSSSFTPMDQMPSLESYAESKFLKPAWSPNDFVFGQVWAMYCGKDAMPRRYIHINDVISESQVYATFLEPQLILHDEIVLKKEMLPVACGMFELSKMNNIVEMLQVSYIVQYQQCTHKPHYMIYPMKGEIWAMYKNWNENWKQTDYESCQCWVVEVLSEFSIENGIKIARLGEVEDCVTLFHRETYEGFDMARTVSQAEMLSFSHQIPAYKVPGIEMHGIPEGAWHLEPNALPLRHGR